MNIKALIQPITTYQVGLYHLLLLMIFVVLGLGLIYDQPLVWSDEAIYMDLAHNLIHEGRLGVDLWQGLLPGVEQYAGWNPPLYFLLLSGWLGITGFSLLALRGLSLLLWFISLYAVSKFTRKLWGKNSLWWLVLNLALALDFVLLRAGRYSRPEVLIIALGSLSLWALGSNYRHRLTLAAALSGLSILAHPYGLIVPLLGLLLLWNQGQLKLSLLKYMPLILGPVIFWWLWLGEWQSLVWQQLSIAASKKQLDPIWYFLPQVTDTLWGKLNLGLLQLSGFVGAAVLLTQSKWRWLGLGLILAWLMSWYGRMMWYLAYPAWVSYLGLGGMLLGSRQIWSRRLAQVLVLALLATSLLLHQLDWSNVYFKGLNYSAFVNEVVDSVPEEATVFVSLAPDPYFAFYGKGRHRNLIMYPALPVSVEAYLAKLNQSDYVVYSRSYEPGMFGTFLERYLEANAEIITQVGEGTGYSGLVIRLVDLPNRDLTGFGSHDWADYR